ncbi:MAG: AMP-binding protein [Deltaproteobacteria bacterium]|nr:AMP-binding protein [Deltaproteobacteria bacterium]
MLKDKSLLEYVQEHEKNLANHVYLTQPTGAGAVVDYTWGQVMDQARRMAAHLQSLGLQPGDKVAILSKNCAHFFIAELAIWLGGFTTVAIFPTESADTVRFVLEHSESKVLFVGKLDTWPAQEPGVPAGIQRIAFPLAPAGAAEGWDAITGRTAPLAGHITREPGDLAMIIYTSGSTGTPKGVMHSFLGMSRATHCIVERIAMVPGERVLSYLPLAHIFERAYVECGSLLVGGGHVFFAESLDTFLADLKRARPTVFLSVPRLWLKFQQGVFAKMPPSRLDFLLKIPFLGKKVGKKVLTGLGLDHVRLAGSGSAPIPAELISWYRRLGLNLMEGYAMTEDFAVSHLSTPEANLPGFVGPPYDDVQVRISEEGEVLIKSPGRLIGYYKRPDLDAEVFTEDGFFRTGDQGVRNEQGLLRLTGRVKELFKTAKGKYVAPAPIENKLNELPLIELSCVSGSGQPSAYAMVVLAEDLRKTQDTPETKARVERELGEWLKTVNAGLSGYEQLQMVVVMPGPWTIEDGTLTPTMKLKRAKIEALVEPKLAQWYGNSAAVQWA